MTEEAFAMFETSFSIKGDFAVTLLLLLFTVPHATIAASALRSNHNPFGPLSVYDGDWLVRAVHPWSGAATGATDRLRSRCKGLTLYFVCEQTINGKPTMLIVYTVGAGPAQFNTRSITPEGLAGARGDLTLDGSRWTYLDKPQAGLKGPWSRVTNLIVDRNHIRFEEYESNDDGATWTRTNSGLEEREFNSIS